MKRVAALTLTAVLAAALITGCSSNKPQTSDQASVQSDNGLPTTYALKAGDTLKSVAKQFYGSEDKWPLIYRANADKLTSAKDIKVGLELTIPQDTTNVSGAVSDQSTPAPAASDKGDTDSGNAASSDSGSKSKSDDDGGM